jgi:putative glutamine amidotransferase
VSGNGKRPRVAVTHDADYNVDAYLRAVELAGGEAVAVVAGTEPASMQGFDALLLSGGVDVNPALYGQEPGPKTEAPDKARDCMEMAMLREALDGDKPILAVCRGLQLFNVAHGGTLVQHMEGHESREEPDKADKAQPAHGVRVEDGSRLARILGKNQVAVNSRHHQAVDAVGERIVVSAKAEDGTIEGLERTDRRFAVAVQWHPENMAGSDAVQMRLFQELIESAGAAER